LQVTGSSYKKQQLQQLQNDNLYSWTFQRNMLRNKTSIQNVTSLTQVS